MKKITHRNLLVCAFSIFILSAVTGQNSLSTKLFLPFSPSFTLKQPSPMVSALVCATRVGTMNLTEITVCGTDSARGTYSAAGAVNDGNDVVEFVLHTGDPRTGILRRNSRAVFGFEAGMTYGTRYFISAIAGNDSSGHVALSDTCFVASAGVGVTFYARPTATFTITDTTLCRGECSNMVLSLTGTAPFSYVLRIATSAGSVDSTLTSTTDSPILPLCPTVNTTYRLISVTDAHCTTPLTKMQTVVVSVPVRAATSVSAAPNICSNKDTTLTLSQRLTGATAGGRWVALTTPAPTGFTAANSRFRVLNNAANTYVFGYIVTPAANSACPADTAFVPVNVLFSPISEAGIDDTITCLARKRSITLGGEGTSTGADITLSWTGPNGYSSNTPRPIVSVGGTYILRAATTTCFDLDTVVVFVDTIQPVANIAPVTQIINCATPVLTLNGRGSTPANRLNYFWRYNNILNQGTTDTINIGAGGSYTLQVTNSVNNCTDTDTVVVVEDRNRPTVTIQKPANINCNDSTVVINASNSSSGTRYVLAWRTNTGRFVRDSNTLVPTVRAAGQYKLIIQDTISRCSDSAQVTVVVDTIRPTVRATVNDTLNCLNTSIVISGRGSSLGTGLVYNWTTTTGNIVSGATTLNPTVDAPGYYTLSINNTKNGCRNADSVLVSENTARPTDAVFSIKNPSCYGECDGSVTVNTVVGGTAPYLYSLDGKVYTTRNTLTNQCAGSYKLYVQDANGCQIEKDFVIEQNRQLVASLGGDTIIRLGDSLLLRVYANTNAIKSIIWQPQPNRANCVDSTCALVWVQPTRQTQYRVTVVDTNNCSASAVVTVSLDKNRPVFMPSAFSPNNDGENDVFMIHGSQVVKVIKSFQIYDRWGTLMFTKQNFRPDDPSFGWDGTINNRQAPLGVYTYFFEVEYLDGSNDIIAGDITLFR